MELTEGSGRKWFMSFFIRKDRTASLPPRSCINSGEPNWVNWRKMKGEENTNDSINFPTVTLWLCSVTNLRILFWIFWLILFWTLTHHAPLPARSPTDTTNQPPDQYWILGMFRLFCSKQKHKNPLWKLLWSPCTATHHHKPAYKYYHHSSTTCPNARLNRAPDVDQLQIHSDCESFVEDKKGLLAPSSYLSTCYLQSILPPQPQSLPLVDSAQVHLLTLSTLCQWTANL